MTFSEHHLRRLDRQNRLLRILVAAALALIAARELALPAQSSPGVLEASSFLLRDDQGRIRGRLSIQNNEPSFALLDEKGRVRAGLSLNGDGVPSLALFDEDANSVAVIGITANRSPGFDFYDKAKGAQAALSFDQGGKPILSLVSKNRVLWQAP